MSTSGASGQTTVDLEDLPSAVGRASGPCGWHEISAGEVADFATATGSASEDGEVPPLMVLALTNRFLPELLTVAGAASGVNYGTGAVLFGPPIKVGSRLRASAQIVEVTDVAGGVQAVVRVTHQVEGVDDPACVVDTISRYLR